MNGVSPEAIQAHAFAFVLILSRIGGAIALLPGLGEVSAPLMLKAGLALCLTLLMLPLVEPALPPRPENQIALALMVAAEIGNGLWFGWLVRVLTVSLPAAGQIVAECVGLSNVLQPSQEFGSQTTAVARWYEVAVPALFLTSGLYTLPLTALAGYYRLIPPGTALWAADSAAATVTAVAESFALALRLASPFILMAIVWQSSIGLVARLVPRLQVFFVAMPGQIAIGLLLLAFLGAPLTAAWMQAMRTSLSALPGTR